MTKKDSDKNQAMGTARDYAKQNIQEVKKAQENFLNAMAQAQASFYKSTGLAQEEDVDEFNNKTLDYIKSNLESGYELATKLVDVTDVSEAVDLQNEYVRKQLQSYTEQAQELTDLLMNTQKK